MMTAFIFAVMFLLLSAWSWKVALSIPSAAGAGAAGSIVLLACGICGVISLVCFGVTIGIAIAS